MGSIIIGTSGYSYRDWVGPFYPEDITQKDYLSFYSSVFPFTELNFSYYRQPEKRMTSIMVDTTPPGFLFTIKANKNFTHEVTEDWRKETAVYREGIEPLVKNDRLLGILLQFPYSFHYTKDNRKYLSLLAGELEGLPLFVEFRNDEWHQSRVYEAMTERNLHTVAVDAPSLPKLPHEIPPVLGEKVYIRFHGRNKAEWWTGDNVSRYDYLYSPEELSEWVPVINDLSSKAAILIIAFNNHHKGKGPQNALQLKALLAGGPNEVS